MLQVSIAWSSEKEEFVLHFGITGKAPESNPHQLVERELTREFNKYKNLPYLLYVRNFIIEKIRNLTMKNFHKR